MLSLTVEFIVLIVDWIGVSWELRTALTIVVTASEVVFIQTRWTFSFIIEGISGLTRICNRLLIEKGRIHSYTFFSHLVPINSFGIQVFTSTTCYYASKAFNLRIRTINSTLQFGRSRAQSSWQILNKQIEQIINLFVRSDTLWMYTIILDIRSFPLLVMLYSSETAFETVMAFSPIIALKK